MIRSIPFCGCIDSSEGSLLSWTASSSDRQEQMPTDRQRTSMMMPVMQNVRDISLTFHLVRCEIIHQAGLLASGSSYSLRLPIQNCADSGLSQLSSPPSIVIAGPCQEGKRSQRRVRCCLSQHSLLNPWVPERYLLLFGYWAKNWLSWHRPLLSRWTQEPLDELLSVWDAIDWLVHAEDRDRLVQSNSSSYIWTSQLKVSLKGRRLPIYSKINRQPQGDGLND